MAVIEISRPHLEQLLGQDVDVERLEEEGSMMGVLFEDADDDKLEVEVEPNRPDLLSVEGIARELRGFFAIETGPVEYTVEDGDIEVEVEESVQEVRPCIACARVRGLDLNEPALNSIIQLQEKLTETYGRRREKIAIGLHDLSDVEPPVTYRGAAPGDVSFIPLDRETEMDLATILQEHEKGETYGWILDGEEVYPVIQDASENVLSFPPIINSRMTEVDETTSDMFLDVTGTSQKEVETALNIVVAALHERGGTIEAVDVDGRHLPDMSGDTRELDPDYFRQIAGLDSLSDGDIARNLERMRHGVEQQGDVLDVTVPPYRADVMHSYDLIEDGAVGYGYDDIDGAIPDVSTIGGRSETTIFTDKLREIMVGTGAQECMTFILSNRENLFTRMNLEDEDVVEMANPLTEDYTVVRTWLLPSLMEVLSQNTHNRYPQNLFEIGRCSVLSDSSYTGSKDVRRLGYLAAHTDTGFSEVRGILQSLANQLGLELAVEETAHASFADNRCGNVVLNGEEAGVIGELDEEVRENWGLDVPVAGFEIDVEKLRPRDG